MVHKKVVLVIDDCRECKYIKRAEETFGKEVLAICTESGEEIILKVGTKKIFERRIKIPENCQLETPSQFDKDYWSQDEPAFPDIFEDFKPE